MQVSCAHRPSSLCPKEEEFSAKSKTHMSVFNSRSISGKAAFPHPTIRNSPHVIHTSAVTPCEDPGWAREKPRLTFAQAKAGQSWNKGDSVSLDLRAQTEQWEISTWQCRGSPGPQLVRIHGYSEPQILGSWPIGCLPAVAQGSAGMQAGSTPGWSLAGCHIQQLGARNPPAP